MSDNSPDHRTSEAAAPVIGQAAASLSFEDWKMQYRHRVALMAGIKPEFFAETLNMIAEDEILQEQWRAGISANDAADEEMSYWEE